MNRLDILIPCCAAFAIFIFWYIDSRIRGVARQIALDSPLRKVMKMSVELRREFFVEALKLSDEEIDASPRIVRHVSLHLQTWKAHYQGEIGFYGERGEELKRSKIWAIPTTSSQFPLDLAECSLFGKSDGKTDSDSDFGPSAPERLEVLLSHKAIIICARNGRFGSHVNSCTSYKPRPSDLVIPIREDDLQEYRDTYGHDDPDWLMMTGYNRYYRRQGRWASWSASAVFPGSLSSTTSSLDSTPVKPNDQALTGAPDD